MVNSVRTAMNMKLPAHINKEKQKTELNKHYKHLIIIVGVEKNGNLTLVFKNIRKTGEAEIKQKRDRGSKCGFCKTEIYRPHTRLS